MDARYPPRTRAGTRCAEVRRACERFVFLLAIALGLGCASASAAPAADAALQQRVEALTRDGALPPAEIVHQLDAMDPDLRAQPLAVQDRANLTAIQALLDDGRIADAEHRARAMLAEPRRRDDAQGLQRAKLALLRVLLRQSDIKDATPLARELLAGHELFDNGEMSPEMFAAIGTALGRAGDLAPAAQVLIEGIHAADRFDRTDTKAYLLVGLCSLNYTMQNIGQALAYCQQGAALADKTGNKMARAAAAINLALCYEAQGNAPRQLAELEKSLTLSRELGLKRSEGMAQINLSEYAMTRNDWKTGLPHCREGLRIARELADPTMIAVSLTNLGTATAQLGDVPAGIRLYEQGLKTAEDAGESDTVVDLLGGMADLYEMGGRLPDALKAMRRRVEEGDKLFQKSQAEALARLQSRFNEDSRQREIRLLTLDNRLKSAELEQRRLQARLTWLMGALLVLASALLFIAYRRVRNANRALAVENSELEHTSMSDPLTGLLNRRALTALFDPIEPGRVRRQPLPAKAFMMIDADRFKQINDRLGHSMGDAVLVELARRLTRLVRPEDRLFRMGGEEFMLLLPGISEPDLGHLCERILAAIGDEPVVAEDQRIAVTVSIGACRFPLGEVLPFAQDWQRHMHLADLALYHAKATGRNRAVQILRIADGSAATVARIEADFSAALADGLVEVAAIVAPSDR